MRRISGLLVATAVVGATLTMGVGTASAGFAPGTDPAHDNPPGLDAHGDVTQFSIDDLSGTVTLSVTVATFDDPGGFAWQQGGSGPIWTLDVDGDHVADFDAEMFGDGTGNVAAQVTNALDHSFACTASAHSSAATSSYSVSFPASCIGTPAHVSTSVLFAYKNTMNITSTDTTGWTAAVSDEPELPPNAPTGVRALAGAGNSATVSWTAAHANGTPVTGYTVETIDRGTKPAVQAPPGATAAASALGPGVTSTRITGLATGHTYQFEVIASSAAGDSPPSAPTSELTIGDVAGLGATAGYWMVDAQGHVYAFGGSHAFAGSVANAVGIAPRAGGYWVADSTGHVYTFGNAPFLGNVPAVGNGLTPGETITTIAATPTGNGYWLFSNDGRVWTFGDAQPWGFIANTTLNAPIVGSAPTPDGKGYYLVAADGGIFAFGDAKFHGSTGNMHLNKPVVGIAPTPNGQGYWLVASDGGVFAFNAPFRGSMGATHLNQPVAGLVAFGDGYLMVAADGGIFDLSNAPFFGSLPGAGVVPPAPIVGVAALRAPG